jgi:hypothetical protein
MLSFVILQAWEYRTENLPYFVVLTLCFVPFFPKSDRP